MDAPIPWNPDKLCDGMLSQYGTYIVKGNEWVTNLSMMQPIWIAEWIGVYIPKGRVQ